MSTQVRTFTPPQPLGQTLSQPTPRADTPRSIPEQPVLNNIITKAPASPPKKDADYKRVPMDSHHDKKQPGGITFGAQDKLPKLPIPDLEQTVKRYLNALRPLQSSREHGDTEQAVDEFLRNDGPELQEKLQTYAQSKTSYIEQFWYDSYLNFDNPVVLNLNPFFLLEDDPTPARNNQITRAASLVASALEFVRAVRKEQCATVITDMWNAQSSGWGA